MENMNEVFEIEVDNDLKDQNTILKDSVKMSKDGLTTWLGEFRNTHYPNRPITEHFWNVLTLGIQYGVNVKEVLGENILTDLQKANPKRYRLSF